MAAGANGGGVRGTLAPGLGLEARHAVRNELAVCGPVPAECRVTECGVSAALRGSSDGLQGQEKAEQRLRLPAVYCVEQALRELDDLLA